ncbi:MAG: amino acid adenylation domain-containing protein, partial [Acidobacteria bacterium]|nr:amino acid adenylation domain-containing protein [Acidobacteriota bacterium]
MSNVSSTAESTLGSTLVRLFERQVTESPDHVALRRGEEVWTYTVLDGRANQLARRLRDDGIGPGDVVAICLERSPDLIVAVLATIKAGAAYLPLDPAHPRERLAFMLNDARPTGILTTSAVAGQLDLDGIQTSVLLDMLEVAVDLIEFPEAPLLDIDRVSALLPQHPAYVIYTSGSTGLPKAVVVSHASAVESIRARIDYYSDSSLKVLPLSAPVSFDISVAQIFWTLCSGATLLIFSNDDDASAALVDALSGDASHVMLSSSAYDSLLATGDVQRSDSLRAVIVGGEAMSGAMTRRHRDVLEGVELFNEYGATEASIWSTVWRCGDEPDGEPVPVGLPIANTEILILDEHLRICPTDVVGEVYVAGAGLAEGYLSRPALTASRFVANPFEGAPGERLYRTGDRACWREDGALVFRGRSDQQVKVRGFRIEPAEIEAVLLLRADVAQAVVIARDGSDGNAELVACVVPRAEILKPLDVSALQAHLAERLPAYMVPASVAVIDAVPLTFNGKVDRAALAAVVAHDSAATYVAPVTPEAVVLCELVGALLAVPRVGLTDHFFRLGGHSLAATRLVAQVRARLGRAVSVRAVFETPEIGTLARVVRAQPRVGVTALVTQARPAAVPASFAQARLWFVQQLEGVSAAYHIPLALRLTGPLDVDALARAITDVADRHESLRTRVVGGADGPIQLIGASSVMLAIRASTPTDITAAIAEETAGPFDLAREGPLRATMWALGPDDHALLLLLHHSGADGWSVPVLLKDLATAYAARRQGQPPGWAPLPVQYADYAQWQRLALGFASAATSPLARQCDYWRTALANLPVELALPTDRPRPRVPGDAGGTIPFALPADVHAGLHSLAHTHGATLFMVLQAAVAAWLTKLGAGTDIPIGAPIAGRTDAALDDLIGCFVNTLVLRTDTSGNPSFDALVDRARQTCLDAYAHADVPFDLLVEDLAPPRVRGRQPLFQTMLVLQHAPPALPALPGVTSTCLPVATRHTKFDLVVTVTETQDPDGQPAGLTGELEYRADLFDARTVTTLAARLTRLVAQVAADATRPLHALEVLTPAERHQLLEVFTATAQPNVAGTLVDRLELQVARTPNAVAVTGSDATLTYAALDRQANQLAWRLRALGAGPETRVALYLDRSPELIVALLAVLKAGAAYLPLDPAYPAERLAWLLADAEPVCVISTKALAPSLSNPALPILLLDQAETRAQLDHASPRPLTNADRTAPLHPGHGAYVIYTSGSTGTPKGVLVSHENVTRLFDVTRQWFDFDRHDVWALFHSYAFDFSVWEMWGALLHGGRLVIVPAEVAKSAEAFRALLARQSVTVLNHTPSAFYRFAQGDEESVAADAPLALRTVIFGGEALDLRRLESWYSRHPERAPQLVNMYGITETTVHVTYARLDRELAATGPRNLVGSGLSDLRVYVLDSALQPCPVGSVGEMYVAGAGLARGYWKQSGLTAERFVANPFGTRPGERLYRTGDLAAWREDGTLLFHGRGDRQVKIRGFRIEPAEIEVALLSHPEISQAAVIADEDYAGDTRLVAYIVPRTRVQDAVVDLAAIRSRLASSLPEHLVPAAFVVLGDLPLNSNGKLDRAALPAPTGSGLAAGFVAPVTHEETVLCELVANLLGLERVGTADHFFLLGGHSLMATRLAAQIRARLGRELPLRLIFESPVLGDLAGALHTLPLVTSLLVRSERPARLPLSFAQSRLWFIHKLEGPRASYNVPVSARLSGPLDIGALTRAIDDVRGRHETLRTRLVADSDGPHQQIVPTGEMPTALQVINSTPATLDDDLAREAGYCFDLALDLPLRAILFRLASDDHALLILLHHSAADGWSIAPLLDDLSCAYAARRSGAMPDFAPLPVQYADYTLWQRATLGTDVRPTGVLAAQEAYWSQTLARLPVELPLPVDRDRPRTPSETCGVVTASVPTLVHDALAALASRQDATLFMVLHAAVSVWLTRLGAGTDILLGTPVAGRADVALDRLVGFFLNTLVLRVDTGGDPTFVALLARARTACLGAYAHQDIPFERLVEVLDPPRVVGRQPLFQTMLVLENTPQARLSLPDIAVAPISPSTRATKFDLTVSFRESRDVAGRQAGMSLELEYSADLFERKTAEALVARLLRVLAHVAADPSQRLHQVELLTADEWHTVVHAYNDTDAFMPALTIGDAFEQQASWTPEAVAMSWSGGRSTYAELDERTNQLAWLLRRHGVGPETRVAVWLERSPELVIAVLAILKTGGAYLPLDPEYPIERISFLLTDARPALLLTSQALASRGPQAAPTSISLDAVSTVTALAEIPSVPLTDADRTTSLQAAHPAYLLYTSGSTGVPKGVVISQASIAHYIEIVKQRVLGADAVRMPLFTAAVFDLTLTTLFAPLLSGGQLQIIDAGRPADVVGQVFAPDATSTAIKTTPSHLALLPVHSDRCSALSTVIVGGEALLPAHVASLRAYAPGVRVFNEYGPTETTVGATGAFVDVDDVHIGRPYPNSRVYVLDGYLRPCPIGVIGELYIAGVGLARGYWERPGLTAERFVANPFDVEGGTRLYRSGDRAAWRADGSLLFHGRADEQVKIRGVRVEPAETAAVLLRAPGVGQAAVTVGLDSSGDARLVAHLVPQRDDAGARAALDLLAVREFTAACLPEACVPAAFVVLEALPLTVNGKLDRAALPAPVETGLATGYVAPATDDERLLCTLVAELLGLDRVGVADHFFHLGGHSLMATRLVAQIRERLGCDLPLRTIFDTPVLRDLARAIRGLAPAEEGPALVANPGAVSDPFPLTPVQGAYWLGRQQLVELSDVACHVYVELRMRHLDVARFTDAWRAAITRHPMLRAIVLSDGTQRILESVPPYVIRCADYSNAGAMDAEAAVAVVRDELSHQVLATDQWPLFDVRVTRISEHDWRLHVSIDALILDGESITRLVEEVFSVYEGKTPPLPVATVTFRDYVLHLEELTTRAEAARAYWTGRVDRLPPAPALPLAVDPARLSDSRFTRHHGALLPAIWTSLTTRAAAVGVTPAAVLLTAYAEVLGTWARRDDFTLNLTVSDRRVLHPDVARMLGVFTNLTPLAITGAVRESFRTRVRAQHRQLAADLDHRAVSGVEVQRLLAQRAGDPQAGLLPVVFTSVLGEPQVVLPADVDVVHSITQTPQTWLDNKVYEQDGGLGIDWDAPAALFPAGLLDAMFAAYVGLL